MTETAPATDTTVVDRDPRRALIAAAIVAGVLVLEVLVNFVESWALSSQSAVFVGGVLMPQLLVSILPKAIGVFLVLWLWASRSDERLMIVLVRALVAAGAGCVLAVVVGIIYAVITYGVRFAELGALPYSPFSGILSSVVALAPLVMLVVLAQLVIRRGARL